MFSLFVPGVYNSGKFIIILIKHWCISQFKPQSGVCVCGRVAVYAPILLFSSWEV